MSFMCCWLFMKKICFIIGLSVASFWGNRAVLRQANLPDLTDIKCKFYELSQFKICRLRLFKVINFCQNVFSSINIFDTYKRRKWKFASRSGRPAGSGTIAKCGNNTANCGRNRLKQRTGCSSSFQFLYTGTIFK